MLLNITVKMEHPSTNSSYMWTKLGGELCASHLEFIYKHNMNFLMMMKL